MSDKTSLGDRMKAYEGATRAVLPPRTYSVIRVDIRAAHAYLRDAKRPFDEDFMAAMDETAKKLCDEIGGAVFAYVQSDEISVLVTDFASTHTQPWFGGVIAKMVSISAATASLELAVQEGGRGGQLAAFDSRVFTLPNPVEVANYFLWRQRDAVRNSISMAAQAKFSHRQLHGKNSDQMQEMLWREHGINWSAYPDGCKRGRVVVRKSGEREVTFVDKRTQTENTVTAVRSWWEAEPASHFTADPGGWLASIVPAMPTLAGDGGVTAARRLAKDWIAAGADPVEPSDEVVAECGRELLGVVGPDAEGLDA